MITYDRRGQSRSTRHDPQNFEISQQGRDAVAVTHAAGEKSAIVTPPTVLDAEIRTSNIFHEIKERQKKSGSSEFGMRYELLPSSNYKPDVNSIRKNEMPVFMAAGKVTLDAGAFYGRPAPILAEQFGRELVVFPGHHGSYMVNPREWTETLRSVLHNI